MDAEAGAASETFVGPGTTVGEGAVASARAVVSQSVSSWFRTATLSTAIGCLQTGADDFMTKPVDWALLPIRLERMLVLRKARDLVVPPVDAGASALPVSSAT